MILKKRMNRIKATWWNGCFEKWMIIRFTPYQTTSLPKWMFSPKNVLPFKSSLLLNGKCGIQVRPPKKQWPLPSLLSLSFFYGSRAVFCIEWLQYFEELWISKFNSKIVLLADFLWNFLIRRSLFPPLFIFNVTPTALICQFIIILPPDDVLVTS